jgi:hypothetical protein
MRVKAMLRQLPDHPTPQKAAGVSLTSAKSCADMVQQIRSATQKAVGFSARLTTYRTILPRIRKSLHTHGVLGALWLSVRLPFRWLQERRNLRRLFAQEDADPFDVEHNVETSQRIYQRDLKTDSPNQSHASPYFPTPSRFLTQILEMAASKGATPNLSNLTFIDFGSGKGRVLLVASQFQFRKILGIELSPELNEIANKNIRAYKGAQRCRSIQTLCADFTEFGVPPEPLYVFLYNPTSRSLSQQLADNLMRSLQEVPREAWILYMTPYPVFDAYSSLEKIMAGECCGHAYCLYRTSV